MVEIISQEFLISLLGATFRMAAPFVFITLGQVLTQRSGVLNLGVEGMMTIGAFFAYAAILYTGNPWISIPTALVIGGIFGLLFALMVVKFRVNQVITGIATNILCAGVALFLFSLIKESARVYIQGFQPIHIPVLSQIPVLGPILFQHDVLVYLALVLVPLFAILLSRTTYGLKIKAVGENPRAADVLGVNVYQIRYSCVILGSAMAALAGAYLVTVQTHFWLPGMIAGRGWIGIALVYFGLWGPYRCLLGSLLFGGMDAFQLRLQSYGVRLPSQLLWILPFFVVIVFLTVIHRKAKIGRPSALSKPYVRG